MTGLKIVATGILVVALGYLGSGMTGPGPISGAMLVAGLSSIPVGIVIAIWA